MLTTTYAGLSDIGRQRSRNDDRWGTDPAQGLYIVADGVGSTTHGDMAAELVVETLPAHVARHFAGVEPGGGEMAERLAAAVVEMSSELHARSLTDAELAGAGTTLVAAMISDSRAVIVHLGDSRAYLYRDRQVQRLTSDHTLVQAVVDAGEITEEEAARHPKRSIVTRHVLMNPPAKPDVSALDLQPGDRILLCSDGLHGVVDDATLAAILADHPDPAGACQALIEAANNGGGPDNVTAVVVDADGAPPEAGQVPSPPATEPTVASPVPPLPAAEPTVAGQLPPTPPPRPRKQPVSPAPPGGVPPRTGTLPAHAQSPRRRRAPKLALAGLVVVLLAAAGVGYLLWPRQSASQNPTGQTAKPSAQAPPPTAQSVRPNLPLGPPTELLIGLDHPKGVAVDTAGNLYVLVVKGDKTVVLKLAEGQKVPTELQFGELKDAFGITVDGAGKNVYVTDRHGDGRLMKWTEGSNEAVELTLGTPDGHALKNPSGVAVHTNGDVYVVDNGNNRVIKLPGGGPGNPTVLPFSIQEAVGVAVTTNGDVYVIDHGKTTNQGNSRLLKLAVGSNKQEVLPVSDLDDVTGVAVDTAGDVYITDRYDHEVLKVSAGSNDPATLPFIDIKNPTGVAVDAKGIIYVSDDETGKVLKLPPG